MKKITKFMLAVFIGGLLLWGLSLATAHAQLVLVNEKYRVKKVDTKMSRLEVLPVDSTIKNITYVLVDGYTICSHKGKVVDWTDIEPETIVRVKGGLQWDMKIKAYKIYF